MSSQVRKFLLDGSIVPGSILAHVQQLLDVMDGSAIVPQSFRSVCLGNGYVRLHTCKSLIYHAVRDHGACPLYWSAEVLGPKEIAGKKEVMNGDNEYSIRFS